MLKLDSACNILAGSADGNISEISADTFKLIDTIKSTTDIISIGNASFSLKIYPQPSSNQINFVSEKEIVNGKFLLTDITGRTLQQFSLGTTDRFTADISSITNGIYFYQILSHDKLAKAGKVEVLK